MKLKLIFSYWWHKCLLGPICTSIQRNHSRPQMHHYQVIAILCYFCMWYLTYIYRFRVHFPSGNEAECQEFLKNMKREDHLRVILHWFSTLKKKTILIFTCIIVTFLLVLILSCCFCCSLCKTLNRLSSINSRLYRMQNI